jgi:hypothetical protein
VQKKDHELDHKKIEAKAAVPKNAGGSSGLTRKMFVGGTVRLCRASDNLYFWYLCHCQAVAESWKSINAVYNWHMGKYCGVLSRGSLVRTSSGHTLHSLGTLRILWYVCCVYDQASSALGLSKLLKLPGHPCCSISDMSCHCFPQDSHVAAACRF